MAATQFIAERFLLLAMFLYALELNFEMKVLALALRCAQYR